MGEIVQNQNSISAQDRNTNIPATQSSNTGDIIVKPRVLSEVMKRCIAESVLSGEEFYYSWSVKSKDGNTAIVEGPSIHLAMAAARHYGNISIKQGPIHETKDSWIFTTIVQDLESGFNFQKNYKMSKNFPVYGKLDDFRKEDIRFQIAQSKSTRNAILSAIPHVIISRMMDAAKSGVRKQVEAAVKRQGIEKVKASAVAEFAKLGVSREMLERKVGSYSSWDIDVLVSLAGDMRALRTGEESVEAMFHFVNDNDEKHDSHQADSQPQLTMEEIEKITG